MVYALTTQFTLKIVIQLPFSHVALQLCYTSLISQVFVGIALNLQISGKKFVRYS